MVEQVRRGLSYRRFLATNFLAGIRYDLSGGHGVYVAHAVNQIGLNVPREDQFLPLFYHLGVLKSQDRKPYLRRIADGDLPDPRKAEGAFQVAMRDADRPAAMAGLLALSRAEGPRRAFERLWPYAAARNLRSGGHTAVAVSNAFRTLETIGWEHAEPVLQFLADECCGGADDSNPVCDQNAERSRTVAELPPEWTGRRGDRAAVLDLVALYRSASPDQACQTTDEQLRNGVVRAADVWDAVFLTTAELLARFPWCGPAGLAGHAVTCTNALHFAFRTVTARDTRLLTVLEAVQWTTRFLRGENARDPLRKLTITEIAPVELPKTDAEAVEAIFGLLPPRRYFHFARSARADQDQAMQMAYALARRTADHGPFFRTAERLLCRKSSEEVHDFKFPVACFEHYRYASAEWKPNLLAASVHYLHGTRMDDSAAVREAREALSRS
jgi:hypothetical protein